jgi:hypothetical protein
VSLLLATEEIKMYEVGVASSGITFIPNFVKVKEMGTYASTIA